MTEAGLKRRRVKDACSRCQKAKTKCLTNEGHAPKCDRCHRLNADCVRVPRAARVRADGSVAPSTPRPAMPPYIPQPGDESLTDAPEPSSASTSLMSVSLSDQLSPIPSPSWHGPLAPYDQMPVPEPFDPSYFRDPMYPPLHNPAYHAQPLPQSQFFPPLERPQSGRPQTSPSYRPQSSPSQLRNLPLSNGNTANLHHWASSAVNNQTDRQTAPLEDSRHLGNKASLTYLAQAYFAGPHRFLWANFLHEPTFLSRLDRDVTSRPLLMSICAVAIRLVAFLLT